MKFATPLIALALFVTRRNCSADAAGTTGDGLIDSEVGCNEKEHHFPVGRRLQALQIFKNNLDLSLCLNWDHQNITHPSLVSLRTCDGSPAQSWYVDASSIRSSEDNTKCLQADGNNWGYGGSASVSDCDVDGSLNQQWVEDGSGRLQDQEYGLYLGLNGCYGVESGDTVLTEEAYDSNNPIGESCIKQQQWIAAPAPIQIQIFKNNLDPSLCLNWDHQNITHPSLVSLQTCDGSPAQSWYVDASKNSIRGSEDNTKCLQSDGLDTKWGYGGSASVSDCDGDGSLNQQWVKDGSGRLQDQEYGLYLSLNGCYGVDSGYTVLTEEAYDSNNPIGESCLKQQQWIAAPAPIPAPTNLPTPGPSHFPTNSPSASPTANPSKAPSPGPTNLPTPAPSHSPTNQLTPAPSHSPTNSPTPAIDSWDLELISVDSNFDNGSESEITLAYKIGAGRKFEFIVLKKGCKEAIYNATIITTNSTSPNDDDPSLDNLDVFLDVKKDTIVGSNTWNSDVNFFEFCLSLSLLSSSSGEVIKKLERDFGVELLFDTAFETVNEAKFGQITLGSNQTDAQVENYIEACTCDSMLSFECNQNVLGSDDFLNICIKSVAEEMKIDYLDSLKMVQEDKTLDIVSDKTLVDGSISSKSKVALKNGVHVASVIPAIFFSYDKSSTAQVSGVVFLKLAESRRRLAVDIDSTSTTSTAPHARVLQSVAGDQESAFAMEVQLKKNEFGVDADSNGAIYAVMVMAGVISGATAAIVTATAMMMLW